MRIYREYNKYERVDELRNILCGLQNDLEKESDPEKRLFIIARIKNLKRQIKTMN